MARIRWLTADLIRQRRRVQSAVSQVEQDRRALARARRRFLERTVGRPLGLAVFFGAGFLVGWRRVRRPIRFSPGALIPPALWLLRWIRGSDGADPVDGARETPPAGTTA